MLGATVDVHMLRKRTDDPRQSCVHHRRTSVAALHTQFEGLTGGLGCSAGTFDTGFFGAQFLHCSVRSYKRGMRSLVRFIEPDFTFVESDDVHLDASELRLRLICTLARFSDLTVQAADLSSSGITTRYRSVDLAFDSGKALATIGRSSFDRFDASLFGGELLFGAQTRGLRGGKCIA